MPLKSKKARQAKSQRIQGEKFFKKGFIDYLDDRNDPDWVGKEGSDSDSEFEGDGGWAVSISERGMPDLTDMSDSEDEGEDVVEVRNATGGTKRKVAIDKKFSAGDSSDDENEEGVEDAEARHILSQAEVFWKEQFSKVSQKRLKRIHYSSLETMLIIFIQPIGAFKPPPPLKSKGTYSGTSRANIYKTQAKLRKAAVGSAQISGFFMRVPKPTREPVEVLEIGSSSSEESLSDSEEEWVDIPSIPESHSTPATPASNTPIFDIAPELLSGNDAPNNNTDPIPLAHSFLDPTADDEFEPIHIPIGTVVSGLIKDATKHKSFGALFKLHAVRNYLELHKCYRLNPNIKNPAMRASLAVARSVGKGPYLAHQIRHLVIYINKFHTIPPSCASKHHAHPSLLNNERVYQAV